MAAYVVHANLDCEATWAGVALPAIVQQRISLYGALVAALAPAGADVEVWVPAAIDAGRLRAAPGWMPPAVRVGAPPRADLRWAAPDARAANDRRLALAVAREHGVALPGARELRELRELDELGVLAPAGSWVCKAPWSAAGRDRCHGEGAPTPEQRTRLARLLARAGALVLEPWCDRLADAGVCARVAPGGRVTTEAPHGLVTDARGGFLGIDLAPPALEPHERAQLDALARAAGAALARLGYAGPFAIDAFAYRDGRARRFHPLCEINARYTFGWIARALAARLGARRLGFGPAPAGATALIAPAGDGVTAWIA